jgi:hypothetical protein
MTTDLLTVVRLLDRIAPPADGRLDPEATARRCAALGLATRSVRAELEALELLTMPGRPAREFSPMLASLPLIGRDRIERRACGLEAQARETFRVARDTFADVLELLTRRTVADAREAAVMLAVVVGYLIETVHLWDVAGACYGHAVQNLAAGLLDRIVQEAGLIAATIDGDHEAAARALVEAVA